MEPRIFTKIFLVVSNYLMSLSLKFRKDPCFRWGDIQLLVTMYIWFYTLNYSQFLTENFDFFGTPSWKCFYIFSARYLSLKERKRIRAFFWKNEPRRTSALHMIWWHSANRDVLPGWFQPYGTAHSWWSENFYFPTFGNFGPTGTAWPGRWGKQCWSEEANSIS